MTALFYGVCGGVAALILYTLAQAVFGLHPVGWYF